MTHEQQSDSKSGVFRVSPERRLERLDVLRLERQIARMGVDAAKRTGLWAAYEDALDRAG